MPTKPVSKPITNTKPLLSDFIRAHRERLSPEQVGLTRGPRRRAKGLRREELAQLCNISPTWLTWIEQGRTVSLSNRTLANLASALNLTSAERAYLFDLASARDQRAAAKSSVPPLAESLQPALKAAVSAIKSPAYVLDHAWNAVAWNRPAALLFVGWLDHAASARGRTVERDRNLLNYTFLNQQARRFIDDWPGRAKRLVAEFRADRSASLQEPETRRQVDALKRASSEFEQLWRDQRVLGREGGERAFNHPSRGKLCYRQLTLRLAQAEEMKLVMLV